VEFKFWTYTKHNYRCTSSIMGHPHISIDTWQYLNEHIPDRWICRGGPQKWPLRSPDLTPHRFPCLRLHEKHGVWTHGKHMIRTTFSTLKNVWITLIYANLKSHWISDIRSSVTLKNRTHVCMTFWLGMNSGIRSWSNGIKSSNTLCGKG
jgi:hypothetical protein